MSEALRSEAHIGRYVEDAFHPKAKRCPFSAGYKTKYSNGIRQGRSQWGDEAYIAGTSGLNMKRGRCKPFQTCVR